MRSQDAEIGKQDFYEEVERNDFRGKWKFMNFAGFEERGASSSDAPQLQKKSYSSCCSFSFIFKASATLVCIMLSFLLR